MIYAPQGTILPVSVGYKLVHPLEDRRDVGGVPGCLVTFLILDRRPIVSGPREDGYAGDVIDEKIRNLRKRADEI